MSEKCSICKKSFDLSNLYEYRGHVACEKCFDKAQKNADIERAESTERQHHKTERFRGLDLGDSAIGKANRQILKADIEIARKS